jgi:hypothetical protein
MAIEARKMEMVTEEILGENLNPLQKYVLLRAHPRKIVLDVVALMWEVYFLWNGNWKAALGVFLAMNTIGLLPVRKTNFEALAHTVWGKLALLHLQPMNLMIQLTGVVFSVSGLLRRDGLTIMTGLSLIYVGHFYGWSKVHPAFKLRE